MEISVKISHRNDKLQAMRRAVGLSQSQLAAVTGISVRMIQHYEQGEKDLNAAKIATVLKLCNALDCGLQDILTDPETLELLETYRMRGGQ